MSLGSWGCNHQTPRSQEKEKAKGKPYEHMTHPGSFEVLCYLNKAAKT